MLGVSDALPWREWVARYFASYTYAPFADRHVELWEWAASLERGVEPPAFIACWPRGGAKCLAGNTEVLRADGTRIAIRDISVGETILSYGEETGRIQPDTIIDKIHSGMKSTITITTRSRKAVRLTSDHRVLTFEGWKRSGEVTIGDRIASPRYTPVVPYVDRTDEEVRFLAYMLAEGGTSGRGCRFTNADPVIVADFIECAESLGFTVRPSGSYGYYISGASAWVSANGLRGSYATDKRIPDWVYGLSEHQKWMFLAAFVDTDGWVQQDRGRIGITLASRGMVADLQYLFMQVGIVTTCYEKPNAHAGAWALVVAQENAERCAKLMPLRLKGDRLQAALAIPRYSLVDTYPPSVARNLPAGVNRKIRNAGISRLGTPYDVTRGKIRRAMAVEPLDHWVKLESADVFWDKVTAIEEAGVADTYDVEVETNHNLITDGLVTHNSSTVELACAWLGTHPKPVRNYVLYVSETQAQADRHVQSIGAMLEKVGVGRAVNEYGASKGWKHQELRASNGFNVTAMGLDSAMRGAKLEEFRPDLIVFDDIDGLHDSANTVKKKIRTITTSILPAGSTDPAVIVVQNLIHEHGIMAQLIDGTADFLHDRIPARPIPAVIGLEYEKELQEDGTYRYRVTGGTPTWEGQNLRVCERQINKWGLTAFLQEAQHDVSVKEGGIIKRHWWGTYQTRPMAVPIVQSWDTAFKDGKSNDYSVCVTMAYTESERWILDVYRERLQFPDLERMAIQMHAQWQPHAVLIEDKASGQSLVQSLARHTGIPAIPVPVNRDKVARANEMSPVIESGRVKLPEAALWLTDYLTEMTAFPLGTHDDQVDATMQALKWVQGRTIGGGQGGSWIADDDEDDDYGRWQ